MTSSKPTTWGLDGDIIAYSVGFAAEKDPVGYALTSTRQMIQGIVNELGAEGVVFLTGTTNFRTEYGCDKWPYKGQRKGGDKPRHLQAIRTYMIEQLDAAVSVNEEADDLLSINASQNGWGIATLDKDLNGCSGWHYNWRKELMYYVTEEEADRFFYTQMLTGDPTDNIPGLFRMVGMKASAKIKAPLEEMTDPVAMYDYVRSVYADGYDKVGMCLDDKDEVLDNWITRIGRQLWMRREVGELWVPPHA
tara:strand:- start:3148 stop:3894 length:747 start_codon:yes stop_codon:yes gene_type:complete